MTTKHTTPIPGKRIRIFVGEAQEWHGKPLYRALVEVAQQHDMLVATVLHGIEGFGPEHRLSTERLPDISENLPMVVEIIDEEAQVEALLPVFDQMVQQGTITLASVELLLSKRRVSW
jgi:PII-like signaling protein